MDRRTIIFIVSLSLAFFGLQFAFQYYETKNRAVMLEKKLELDKKKEAARQSEIISRTATLATLPLYFSDNETIFARQDGFFVALASQDGYTWNDVISLEGSEAQDKIKASRVTSFEQFGLYKEESTTAKTLVCPQVPSVGRIDLQLVSRSDAGITITLAELVDGRIEFPGHSVGTLAMAFLKVQSQYQPIGYFDPSTYTIQPFSSVPAIRDYATTAMQKTAAAPEKETFYCLENEYQQIIISSKGAAVVEINLPFKTQEDKESAVLPINIDREMIKQSPQNALFPLFAAIGPNGEAITRKEGGFYPLLRRDIAGKNDVLLSKLTTRENAFNIVSEYPEVANLNYSVKKYTDQELVLEASQPHRRITKTYTLPKEASLQPYCFTVKAEIEGDSRGLSMTSGLLDVEWISGSPAPQIKYLVRRNDKQDVEQVDLPKEAFNVTSITPDWVANSNGFFGIIMDPTTGIDSGFRVEKISGIQAPSRLTMIDQSIDRYKAHDLPAYELFLPIKPNSKVTEVRIFAGPFAGNILEKVDDFYAQESGGRSSDYTACQTFHGWFSFISEPFAKFLFFMMKLFYRLFGSWALSIVLVTVVLRILLYPLNSWSMRSMKAMQIVAPKIKAIQDKYKKEPQKAQMEILALYREYKVNPLSGCLPLLLQMPFLIGMFDLLKSTFELRGASFIPGWIDDLAAPDVLFSWKYSLPLIGNEFHLLPIILGGIMFVQQRMSATLPKDPAQWTDQQRQQRSMGTIMTVVMTVLFYQFPSGLNIYWISSMLLSVGQQWWTNRSMEKGQKAATVINTIKK